MPLPANMTGLLWTAPQLRNLGQADPNSEMQKETVRTAGPSGVPHTGAGVWGHGLKKKVSRPF